MSVLNFRSGQWDSLSTSGWPKALPHPEQEVSPDGRVLLKVSAPGGEVTLAVPDLQGEVRTF